MARQENLTVIKGGLNRQRTKGAALKDSLFDLLNGFVTTEKTVKVRPGTLRTELLNAGTKGLVHFDGLFHVFATSTIVVPAGYKLHILTSPDDASLALKRVHFAEPFLGALYVAAEFADNRTYHFWLADAPVWLADTAYEIGESVQPTVPNGLVYKARRVAAPNPGWTANTPRVVSDVIEPTTENNFKYAVTQVIGPTPRSGPLEPIWPKQIGAIIVEDLDDVTAETEAPTVDLPPITIEGDPDIFRDPDTEERYGGGGDGPSQQDLR